jgi:16S rRNA (guanine527-N7)-methyltransferase
MDGLAREVDPPTSVRRGDEALDTHVADSLSGLAIAGLAAAKRIVDIGAGAGFPGLVLAAALPAAEVDLLESTERKARVIERLAQGAGLRNARALALRAEDWGAGEGGCAYDAATARAVAPLGVLVEYAAPLLRKGGTLVCWKGGRDAAEEASGAAAAAMLGMRPSDVVRVVPFAGARERHLHSFVKITPTPSGFPRRPGMARKRPLG